MKKKKKPRIIIDNKIKTSEVGDSLPVTKQEHVLDLAGIRPKGYIVEMPNITKYDNTAIELVNLVFDTLDVLEKYTGDHPEYKPIKENLDLIRGCLVPVALDIAGNMDKDLYTSGTQPADVNNILVSTLNSENPVL